MHESLECGPNRLSRGVVLDELQNAPPARPEISLQQRHADSCDTEVQSVASLSVCDVVVWWVVGRGT